jgi:hypothetical protein
MNLNLFEQMYCVKCNHLLNFQQNETWFIIRSQFKIIRFEVDFQDLKSNSSYFFNVELTSKVIYL